MKEEWKEIKGFQGLYQISNMGRVYSVTNEKYLTLMKASNDYLQVRLFWDREHYKQLLVHRLVFEHFVRDINPNEEVHHLDQNKQNNDVSNLIAMDLSQHRRLHMNGNTFARGIHKSKQWKDKIGKANKGKRHTEQTKRIMSQKRKEWWKNKKNEKDQ